MFWQQQRRHLSKFSKQRIISQTVVDFGSTDGVNIVVRADLSRVILKQGSGRGGKPWPVTVKNISVDLHN